MQQKRMWLKSSVIIGGLLLLTSCGNPIKSVIKQNMKGLQNQDIQMVMETVDAKSPLYGETEKQLTRLIQDYTLEYKIESIDILSEPKDEKKKDGEEKHEEKPAEADIFAEVDNDYITEEDRQKAEAAKKKKEEEEKNKPFVARVKVIQVTKQKPGGANKFENNRITVVHTLHKYPTDEKPTWKIFSSNIRDIEFLDEEGAPLVRKVKTSKESEHAPGEHQEEHKQPDEHSHG